MSPDLEAVREKLQTLPDELVHVLDAEPGGQPPPIQPPPPFAEPVNPSEVLAQETPFGPSTLPQSSMLSSPTPPQAPPSLPPSEDSPGFRLPELASQPPPVFDHERLAPQPTPDPFTPVVLPVPFPEPVAGAYAPDTPPVPPSPDGPPLPPTVGQTADAPAPLVLGPDALAFPGVSPSADAGEPEVGFPPPAWPTPGDGNLAGGLFAAPELPAVEGLMGPEAGGTFPGGGDGLGEVVGLLGRIADGIDRLLDALSSRAGEGDRAAGPGRGPLDVDEGEEPAADEQYTSASPSIDLFSLFRPGKESDAAGRPAAERPKRQAHGRTWGDGE